MLTPARRRSVEFLDDPAVDPTVRDRSMRDVARSNRWLGGLRAARLEARALRASLTPGSTLLDVGTGLGDIPRAITADVEKTGGPTRTPLTIVAVDEAASLLQTARDSARTTHAICASATALPLRDKCVDVALCSQLLHHFDTAGAQALIRELHRVARRAVIVCDLRRSWFAALGFWLVSFPLRFHPVTRHDGVVSVLRGFTRDELTRLIVGATGVAPRVHRRLGFRLTASWSTDRAA